MITRSLHKSGEQIYVDMSFAMVKDASGKMLGSMAVARDATARFLENVRKQLARIDPQAGNSGCLTTAPAPGDRRGAAQIHYVRRAKACAARMRRLTAFLEIAMPEAPGVTLVSTLKTTKTASGKAGKYHSLPALAKQFPNVSRLPVSMRIVLESVLRNCDGKKVTAGHVAQVAGWQQRTARR